MKRENKSLNELAAGFMEDYPQILTNIPVKEKVPFETLPELQEMIQKAEKSLAKSGRVMVRYSGTENKCRVLVEAKRKDEAENWSKILCETIKKVLV